MTSWTWRRAGPSQRGRLLVWSVNGETVPAHRATLTWKSPRRHRPPHGVAMGILPATHHPHVGSFRHLAARFRTSLSVCAEMGVCTIRGAAGLVGVEKSNELL